MTPCVIDVERENVDRLFKSDYPLDQRSSIICTEATNVDAIMLIAGLEFDMVDASILELIYQCA